VARRTKSSMAPRVSATTRAAPPRAAATNSCAARSRRGALPAEIQRRRSGTAWLGGRPLIIQWALPPPDDERAPLFGSWSRLYAAVVLYLAVLISLFYAFTAAFNVPR